MATEQQSKKTGKPGLSRVGQKPILLPKSVECTISGRQISVKGAKGSLSFEHHYSMRLSQVGETLVVNPADLPAYDKTNLAAMQGLTRALVQNMVTGVAQGFQKALKLIGTGYRAKISGDKLNLELGFSHPVALVVPAGLSLACPSQTDIIVSGIDKQAVHEFCAVIRRIRPPEPYKGKGIRYVDEVVIKKEVKKK